MEVDGTSAHHCEDAEEEEGDHRDGEKKDGCGENQGKQVDVEEMEGVVRLLSDWPKSDGGTSRHSLDDDGVQGKKRGGDVFDGRTGAESC